MTLISTILLDTMAIVLERSMSMQNQKLWVCFLMTLEAEKLPSTGTGTEWPQVDHNQVWRMGKEWLSHKLGDMVGEQAIALMSRGCADDNCGMEWHSRVHERNASLLPAMRVQRNVLPSDWGNIKKKRIYEKPLGQPLPVSGNMALRRDGKSDSLTMRLKWLQKSMAKTGGRGFQVPC